MHKGLLAAVAVVFCCAGAVYADRDYLEFQRILDQNCSKCHTRERIEQAMQSGRDFDQVRKKMLRFGAQLSPNEQQVLGVFWTAEQKQPSLSAEAGPTVSSDPLGEYRAVLERRCTGCHGLERVEEAMMAGRSIDDLVEMMRQRGAIITESEEKVLGTFWGEPLKKKQPKPQPE